MVLQAKVLHVEDDDAFADMASSFLERVDDDLAVHTESCASDGLEALEQGTYDCIVSDYDMPEMDGIEFLESVRTRDADIPFILYTGKGSEEIASEAISAGVTDYMQKDSTQDHFRVLANRIQNAVTTYRSTRAATRERERLEQTLATISNGALLVDENGTIEYANEAARELVADGIDLEHLTDIPNRRIADGGITEIDASDGSKTVVVDETVDGSEHLFGSMADTAANEASLRELYEAASDCHDSFVENLTALIDVGCNRLGLPFGYVTHITNNEQRIIAAGGDAEFAAGDSCPINKTYCRKTIESADPIAISHAFEEGWEDDPAYDEFGFEVYVGGRLNADGGVYGTLCFGSKTPREGFSKLQLAFLDVLRQMVEDVIQQHLHTKALERQNERLDEFASVISHDLRSPLQTAMGNLQMVAEDVDHPAIEHVDAQLDRIDELIENLLDYAYNGTKIEEFDAVDLAKESNVAWETVDAPDATLSDADLPDGVLADQSRLRQLLVNLFSNAVTHAGGDVAVRVGTTDSGFYVADSGPGLPDDDVFAPGYTTRHNGTGFGLAIVKEIAEAHGWEVTTDSDPVLGGARFEFDGVEFTAETDR